MIEMKILLVAVIIFLILLWLFYTRFFGAEYFPTGKRKIKKMLDMAKVNKKDIVYDLGCGDGRMVIEAAKRCKKAIGIEVDPLRYIIARIRVKLNGQKNIQIRWGNFYSYHYPLDDANVILLFLRDKANEKLKKKLRGLRNIRVVSHFWKFSGWKISRQDKKLTLYLYKIK